MAQDPKYNSWYTPSQRKQVDAAKNVSKQEWDLINAVKNSKGLKGRDNSNAAKVSSSGRARAEGIVKVKTPRWVSKPASSKDERVPYDISRVSDTGRGRASGLGSTKKKGSKPKPSGDVQEAAKNRMKYSRDRALAQAIERQKSKKHLSAHERHLLHQKKKGEI